MSRRDVPGIASAADQRSVPGADGDLAELFDQTVELSRRLGGPLRRVAVRRGDTSVEVDWHEPATGAGSGAAADGAVGHTVPIGVPSLPQVVAEEDVHVVCAPLVGTFYVAPSPGEAPFVAVGDTVSVGQTLGIVEAMKLLNPIVSDVEGQVVEVLVGDGEPVEFEQPLVRVALAAGPPHNVDVAAAG